MRWNWPVKRHRLVALILVLVFEALLILALLTLGRSPDRPRKPESALVAFDVAVPKADAEKAEPSPKATPQKPVTRPAPRKLAQDLTRQPVPTPNMVVISKEDFAASDIANLPKSSAGATGATGAGSKSAYGPGEGPGGKTLYPAEWHVEPSNGALAAYLPENVPEGSWAMVACRTIERYHVDNCVGLGQSHPGLSAALRQAAWQFLVRPPRVDGRPLVGAWVRIRFDFNKKGAE